MDGNNWMGDQTPMVQPQTGAPEQSGAPSSGVAPPMAADDWRTQLPPDYRQRVVNNIMETLTKHLPMSGQEGLQELNKVAVRFEEKIYSAVTSQSDYLRKIRLKMLTMKAKSQSPMAHALETNAASVSRNSPDIGGKSQGRHQLVSQNAQNNVSTAGVQNSASLTSTLPAVSNLIQAGIKNVVGQNSNSQNVQNNSIVSQKPVGNSMGQSMPSNTFADTQKQMQGRPQQVVPQQQQQQQQHPQNPPYLYQHQLQQQLMNHKLQLGGIAQPVMQSHRQQQQQQLPQQQQPNLFETAQIQTSQQAMQPSVMQSASVCSLQQNQQSSVLQTNQQVLKQLPHPQQISIAQQPMLQAQPQMPQQLQPLIGQTSNATNIQQNQSIGQPNSFPDLQQQQHRLISQHNNIVNLPQPQLHGQKNSPSNIHRPHLGSPSGVSGFQQSAMLGTQSVAGSGIQNNHLAVHMIKQKVPIQQQAQQSVSLLHNQTQQLQTQASQHQMMSRSQSQSVEMQHLQQQSLSLHCHMQQSLPASGALLQQQNVVEQQKKLFQSQQAMQEASSTSVDSTAQTGNAGGGDWQEEVYQKIKSMKETYLQELNEIYVETATKLQQLDALTQQPKIEQLDKLKLYKVMLERLVQFLQLNKNDIQIRHKDKLGNIEKQIINIIYSKRIRKPVSLQQGQLAQPHMPGMQHSQPQSQASALQTHENQMTPLMRPMNMWTSTATMAQNNSSALQHNTLSFASSIPNSHQNMIDSLQPASNANLGQSSSLNSIQQVAINSLQQNPLSGPLPLKLGSLGSETGVNPLQSDLNSLQTNSSMLQKQQLKPQEYQMLHSQRLKQQIHQRQMEQQFLQRQLMHRQQQQLPQQHQPYWQQQQMKQQLQAQLSGNPMSHSPLHQMPDFSDLKTTQQMGVNLGVFWQDHTSNQRMTNSHQQVKPETPFSTSSPQALQPESPQVPQQPSPQIDQQSLVSSSTKTGTPLRSANSPLVVPSLSTPLAPSPMPSESEKVNIGIPSLPSTSVGHPQTTNVVGLAQSLGIGTPGISASPSVAEFASIDGANGNRSNVISGKLSAIKQPIERLIKAVTSASQRALSDSVSDISSVISMTDRIAGSAPENGSRAAVGEDLAAMTKCRLQARDLCDQGGPTVTKRLRRFMSVMPSNVVSSAGSINDSVSRLAGFDAFDLRSTATSCLRRPVIESPIEPLRLVIPISYPNCSPILLDKVSS